MDFQAGEVIQLKSGGPAMTVVAVDEKGVHCTWYGEATDDIRTAVIPAIAIEAVQLADFEDDEEEDEDEDKEEKHHKKKHKHDD
jgi:uncharacterized protein YodC (DUF2158 family)